MTYKHSVFMSVARREVVEVHDDYIVVIDHLKPDPKGMYCVMSDHAEPAWATRKYMEPTPSSGAGKQE